MKVSGYLSAGLGNQTLVNGANNLNFGSLLPGDINNDNVVNIIDVSYVNSTFGKTSGQADFNPLADFNCDGVVNIIDISILNSSFGMSGAMAP